MMNAIDRAGRAVAAASLLGVLAFAPGAAWAAGPQRLAQANTAPVGSAAVPAAPTSPAPMTPAPMTSAPTSPAMSPGAPAAAAPSTTGPADTRVAARIADLQRRLAITSAQMPQFDAFASVMRENAQQMDAVLAKRTQETSMNAVEDLKSYAELTEAHAQQLQRLVPAFEALYSSLSPAQQRTADSLLGRAKARAQQQARHKSG